MHEFSIADGIITTVSGQVKPGQKVTKVFVTVGPLSGVSADSLVFCFTELAAQAGLGTPELVVNKAPARLRCNKCDNEYDAQTFYVLCPKCGALDRAVLSGSELTLDSMEVED
jgi:hydrogenase nickel incorporation protein HypA/HybF